MSSDRLSEPQRRLLVQLDAAGTDGLAQSEVNINTAWALVHLGLAELADGRFRRRQEVADA